MIPAIFFYWKYYVTKGVRMETFTGSNDSFALNFVKLLLYGKETDVNGDH